MLFKLVILAALLIPSIMAALTWKEMADALIGANGEDLEKTFKEFESEQDKDDLSSALADVAKSSRTHA